VLPGLVNAHTHLYSGLAPFGMPIPEEPPAGLLSVLERVWWRLDRALDERSLRAAARWYVSDALLAGTTALIDHHESPAFIEGSLDVLADACQDLGMRAVLCYGATERNGGIDEARRGLEECRRFVLTNRRPLVRGVVGLHASFTVSDDTIRAAVSMCRDLGVALHVHLAEDAIDVSDARQRGYAGPLERLVALGALPPGSLLAHGVHLDAEQAKQAEGLGCWLLQNPRSNRHNRVGYPRALRHLDRVALGTDGYPADMVEELDTLRVCAAGFDDDLARAERRLAAGAALIAELFGDGGGAGVALDARDWRDWALDRQQRCLDHLVVDGRVVVERGKLMTADEATLLSEAKVEAERLWSRMAAI
jgi:cytosine/adenosine deaminase-related metal-dependent hydrolase